MNPPDPSSDAIHLLRRALVLLDGEGQHLAAVRVAGAIDALTDPAQDPKHTDPFSD